MNLRPVFLIIACCASAVCAAGGTGVPAPDDPSAGPAHRTGSYVERLTLVSLVGESGARSFADVLEPDHELRFNVYVPDDYDSSSPAGLLVYVSPVGSGAVPESWKKALDRHNLIWVSVDDSGNTMPVERRIAEARLSSVFALRSYGIRPERVYIVGMSGGGQIAGIVASRYPALFRGGIYLCGVNPWSERDADPWADDPPEDFETLKENRYVFISGTEDFKLAATARVYRFYRKAGVEGSKLIVVEEMGHELPDAETFGRALGFLDAGPTITAT